MFQNECPHFNILFIVSFFRLNMKSFWWRFLAVPCIDTHSYCPVFGDFTVVRLDPHLFCAFFCLSKTPRHCFGGALAEVSTYIEHPQQPTGGIAPFFFSFMCHGFDGTI